MESVIRIAASSNNTLIDGDDELFLIIGESRTEEKMNIKHYIDGVKNIEERWMDKDYLVSSVVSGGNRRAAQWVLTGEIIQDPAGYIQSLRDQLSDRSSPTYQKKQYIEYAGFVRSYCEAKEYFRDGHILDSFNSILHSLHHWARLAILEAGEHPETTVWKQLMDIDPSVYKLYEELVTSEENLEKRIELLLLALDFSLFSRMESRVQFLLNILRSRREPWTVEEILDHPSINDRTFEVSLLLQKMARRSLVKECSVLVNGRPEKCYSVS